MRFLSRLRSFGAVGEVVQTGLVVALIAAFFLMQNATDDLSGRVAASDEAAAANAAGIEQISTLLKDTCAVAPDKQLAEEGLLQPCQLAQEDRLDEVLPDAVSTPTPSTGMPQAELNAYVDARVGRYLETYEPKVAGIPKAELRKRIREQLLGDPTLVGKKGDPGAPAPPITDEQVARAVAAIIEAKPPKAIQSTSFDSDGCNLTISYTDGTSDTFGSLCGKKGDDGESKTGPAGRGIESVQCVAGELVVTYDDKATQAVTGADVCPPAPEPTVPPPSGPEPSPGAEQPEGAPQTSRSVDRPRTPTVWNRSDPLA